MKRVAHLFLYLVYFRLFIKLNLSKISVPVYNFCDDRAHFDNENEDDDGDRLWGGGSLDNLIWAS